MFHMRDFWRRVAFACGALVLLTPRLSAQSVEPATLTTPSGVLSGTLQLPAGGGAPYPLVLIIPGSGPTDRNGNTVGLSTGPEMYRLLADSLAAHGIASLRYDKRGIGASAGAMGPERALRFETAATDAVDWVSQVRKDRRFSSIVILGHSEGSLLGMLAAGTAKADGYISVAGVARRADHVLHDQLAQQLPPALLEQTDSVFASLVRGDTVPNTPAALAALFRPSVQPYLISWFRYSGVTEIAKLTMPVLIVQGTHDLQVPMSEADLLASALPRAKVARIVGMNHVLKITPASMAEQQRFYLDPTVPLVGEMVAAVTAFVQGVQLRR
jgi:fermentation-respiration switch protein FrsA (DUF1100 family)